MELIPSQCGCTPALRAALDTAECAAAGSCNTSDGARSFRHSLPAGVPGSSGGLTRLYSCCTPWRPLDGMADPLVDLAGCALPG